MQQKLREHKFNSVAPAPWQEIKGLFWGLISADECHARKRNAEIIHGIANLASYEAC